MDKVNEVRSQKANVLLENAKMVFDGELIIHLVINKENNTVVATNIEQDLFLSTLKAIVGQFDSQLIQDNIQLRKKVEKLSYPEPAGDAVRIEE